MESGGARQQLDRRRLAEPLSRRARRRRADRGRHASAHRGARSRGRGADVAFSSDRRRSRSTATSPPSGAPRSRALRRRRPASLGARHAATRSRRSTCVAVVEHATSVVYPSERARRARSRTPRRSSRRRSACKLVAVDSRRLGPPHRHQLDAHRAGDGGDLAASLAGVPRRPRHARRDAPLTLVHDRVRPPRRGERRRRHRPRPRRRDVRARRRRRRRPRAPQATTPGRASRRRSSTAARISPVTTDFRDVFAEALDRHLGLAKPAAVFPDYGADPHAATRVSSPRSRFAGGACADYWSSATDSRVQSSARIPPKMPGALAREEAEEEHGERRRPRARAASPRGRASLRDLVVAGLAHVHEDRDAQVVVDRHERCRARR